MRKMKFSLPSSITHTLQALSERAVERGLSLRPTRAGLPYLLFAAGLAVCFIPGQPWGLARFTSAIRAGSAWNEGFGLQDFFYLAAFILFVFNGAQAAWGEFRTGPLALRWHRLARSGALEADYDGQLAQSGESWRQHWLSRRTRGGDSE